MSKTDKELAVELTTTLINAASKQTHRDGTPIVHAPSVKNVNNMVQSFYKNLKTLDD